MDPSIFVPRNGETISPTELKKLRDAIEDWNSSRLDLFEISKPTENGEFHGVMRFFFQEAGAKVATKCIRVSSTATTKEVNNALIEKFHPDMRMLSSPKYGLYEIHAAGDERKLGENENPLLVQLHWTESDREGRFLLKVENGKDGAFDNGANRNSKRRLSRREKKELKKKEKEAKKKQGKSPGGSIDDLQLSTAEQHYKEKPDSLFTRSISNPEAVLKRRRELKLEKKLDKIRQRPNSGGVLKVYAHTIVPQVPYKSLLVSVDQTAENIIAEALEKYGLQKHNPANYCLVKVTVPPGASPSEYADKGEWGKETVMKPDESPLEAVIKQPPDQGELRFELKNRQDDHPIAKKMVDNDNYVGRSSIPQDRLPYFLELNPDGTDVIDYKPKRHRLQMDVTEVGSARAVPSTGNYLQLCSQHILSRHCVIANMEGVITVTPTSRDAETYVNRQRIFETTIIQHGAVIQFGKMHTFRFCDPQREEPDMSNAYAPRSPTRPVETTFDVDGNIETTRQQGRGQPDVNSPVPIPRQVDDGLPAILEFRENAENDFLEALIAEVNAAAMPFKLSPTYSVYMALRYRLSRLYRPEMGPTERAQKLTALLNKMADLVERTVQDSYNNAGALAFWLANASELLHFIKHDKDMGGLSQDAQDILSGAVQESFKLLVKCLHGELNAVMNAFLDPSDEADVERDMSTDDDLRSTDSWGRSAHRFNQGRGNYGPRPTLGDVVQTLSSAMTLIRRCRVNAALTIQFFSQLFHYINMWLFNAMVMETQLRLCTRDWGMRIRRRLGRIEAWAEKQGLELAAECHLSRVIQASNLLQSPKSTDDDLAAISSKCFKLNSLQLQALLQNYIPSYGERKMSQDLIERVVRVAVNTADDLSRNDGRPVQLNEDPDPMLPFLLPEDGYSCDIIRGIPNGLQEELAPLCKGGLCRLTPQHSSTGDWTIHLRRSGSPGGEYTNHGSIFRFNILSQNGPNQARMPREEPDVITITFHKHNTPSMGLSIVAAKGTHQAKSGIYIKSVVPGGAAQKDGRLEAGDQLLKVDGNNLCGLTQEKAALFLVKTGKTVTLQVAKKAAEYHDLSTLLSQPSPVMPRAHKGERQPRPKSEDFLRAGHQHSPNQPWDDDRPHDTNSMPRHHASNFINAANKARSSPNLAEDPRTAPPQQRHNEMRPRENEPYRRQYTANTIERTTRGSSPASTLDKANKARSSPNLLVEQDSFPSNPSIYASINKDNRPRIISTSSLRPQDQRMNSLQRDAPRSQSVSQLPPGENYMARPGGSMSNLQRPPQQRYPQNPNYADIQVQGQRPMDPRMQRQDYYRHPDDRRPPGQDYYGQEPQRMPSHSPQPGEYIPGPGGRYPSQQDLRGQQDPRYQPGGYLGSYLSQQQPYQLGLQQNPLHYASDHRLNKPKDDYWAAGQSPDHASNYKQVPSQQMEEDKKKAAMERYRQRVAKQQLEQQRGRQTRPIEAKRLTEAAGPRQPGRAPGHKNAYAQREIPPSDTDRQQHTSAPKNPNKIQAPVRTTPLQSKPGNTNSLPRTQKPSATNNKGGYNSAIQELKEKQSYGNQSWKVEDEGDREKRYEEELERMRYAEIQDLSQMQYRSPEQNDRLEKLMLEHDFQMRLKSSMQDYSDDDEIPPMPRDEAEQERRLQDLQKERMKEQQIEEMHREKQQREEENRRLEEQRMHQQRIEEQRLEQQRLEQHRMEQQRMEQQRMEQQRMEQQRMEQQRMEQQRMEQQRMEQQRLEEEKRQEDARVEQMLRQQEEEMRQRHERQRQEQARREAEIERERQRLEKQMAFKDEPAERATEPYQPKPYTPKPVDPDVLGYMPNLTRADLSSDNYQQNGNPDPVPHVPLAIPKPATKPKPPVKAKPTITNDNNSNHNHNGGDEFGTPQNSQNLNTFKVGDTPTVIGSQEVYKDPRAKILAAKDPGSPKPEEPQKLSFQQKMVMFRKEAGERRTPKERPRSSKWEREFLAENPGLSEGD
ncbi:afadin-like isoform X2 [Anneissia japonica]|uniref:afadin-like isoform X2 n=1 Tax=Anneissia japonica TaxID=1529436 RepID=UPI0014257FF5|nr:afadin-like isoform X2 [Anneissia japonica]